MSLAFERLARERPIVQAGMGGGVARHELAVAVSEAGGLGTLGILAPARLRAELEAARRLTGAPLAVNLLLPFTGREHWEIAETADVVVTFWGKPERRTSKLWLHTCGSVEEACAADAAGADGVVAQGVEAGGHVRGTLPALDLLARVRSARPELPVLLAGGVADARDVREALAAGAVGAVLGTRFLLSDESRAHPRYKEAALASEETVLTELFGLGWPAPHRVVPNAATRRWLRDEGREPRLALAVQRALTPLALRMPEAVAARAAAAQRPGLPVLSPSPPVDDAPLGRLLDAGPLYAGETVARIGDVGPAGALVAELTP
jgi:NAD(P)H-dependent flavin oxidoreductase YrpB (nitropropane dioxygenase family)